MTDVFTGPRRLAEDAVPRDRWKRPLIVPEGGGEAVPYTRASSFGKALDDKDMLIDWSSAMTLLGAARDEGGSVLRAALTMSWKDDKRKLRELVERCKAMAGASDKATEGTTLHALTERIDLGEQLPRILDDITLRDLDAYRRVTRPLTTIAAEAFVVVDELQVAGTFDRLVRIEPDESLPDWLHGRTVIGDLKTGGLDYAVGGFAVQLALYAHGKLYDPETGERTPLGADRSVGLVVHLPQRTGTAALHAVNLDLGWEAARLAQQVRAWRKDAKPSNSRWTSSVIQQVAEATA